MLTSHADVTPGSWWKVSDIAPCERQNEPR
jgi:hypothetical protein